MDEKKLKQKARRAAYHKKNRAAENAKNLSRYHAVYKRDPEIVARRGESFRQYALRMGTEWSRLRSKKYRKAYANLSPLRRSKMREAYKKWAKLNWEARVEYAREYRRRHPLFGLRKAIADAARIGDVRELAKRCESALAKFNENRSRDGSNSRHGSRGMPVRR